MSRAEVQMLLDRAAISDVVHAYATGLDRRDWALFRSIFTDSIEMDFRSVGLREGLYDADKWVRDAERLFAGFSATQHSSSNHVHALRGDEATCTSNMQATHFVSHEADEDIAVGEDCWTIGGYYVNELVRCATEWKLAKVTLVVTWQTGNQALSRIALRRGRALSNRADPRS